MRLPKSSYNWVTLIGATIASVSLFMIIFLFVVSYFHGEGGSYLGLIIYIILPTFLVIGLIIIPIGMWLKNKRHKKGGVPSELKFPTIDLNDVRHRNAFLIFIAGSVVFLFLSAIGSYEAFHYTESVEFCGTTCHTVMKPEYTAYQNSAHAKVACVECHVGSGASWYVRSKLSGLYQVYAVTLGSYPTPIPTPIKNLRPARETCEECHWPEKFYSHKLILQKHFLSDENNSEWDIGLIMKIGAPHRALGLQEGIHWHINPDVKIEYIASDSLREEIPWVRYTNLKTGKVNIFEDAASSLSDDEIASSEIRVMDCMDCHNRPSHNYQPPAFFINNAIIAGSIPKELPEFKNIAMEICDADYSTTEEAMENISSKLKEFYDENYPDVDTVLVERGIAGLQSEYGKNIFPEMKVRWDAYPNHIGHIEFNGCFRCHNDEHENTNGDVIPKDCNLCHVINVQGPPDNLEQPKLGQALEFRHPVDIDEEWKESLCTDCHTGLNP